MGSCTRVVSVGRESTRVDSYRLAFRRMARVIAAQPELSGYRVVLVDRPCDRWGRVFSVCVVAPQPFAELLSCWVAREVRRDAVRIMEGRVS
jgi:hypothetical protein